MELGLAAVGHNKGEQIVNKEVKENVLTLIDTVWEGVSYARTASLDAARLVLEDSVLALEAILKVLCDETVDVVGDYEILISKLEQAIVTLQGAEERRQAHKNVKNKLFQLRKKVFEEPCPVEVIFLPYKASMWDSMESIWMAANADPGCDAYVMPIPYYDRNPDGSFGQFHYEGRLFPSYVTVTDYKYYDLAKRKPDVIYIHNPYDGSNFVTSVAPEYYSDVLKAYTSMLVYVPYFTPSFYQKLGMGLLSINAAYLHVDRIIAPSQVTRRGLMELGIPGERILPLGTPKIDAALHSQEMTPPLAWREKSFGKTCFLVNSSIYTMLNQSGWLHEMRQLFQQILTQPSCLVIWRPHPLLESTIRSMRPQFWDAFQAMKADLLAADNLIYDDTDDARIAYTLSDALICDYSSILCLYGVTGKPVLSLVFSKQEIASAPYLSFDFSEYYFLQDGMSVGKFVQMVCRGEDPSREARLSAIRRSVEHMDGTAGKTIHAEIMASVSDAPHGKATAKTNSDRQGTHSQAMR